MRVENVKGAVWTVDELEYHRRRPQRGAASTRYVFANLVFHYENLESIFTYFLIFFPYSASGKSSPPYSSPSNSGGAFFNDGMLPHDTTTPIPPHIAGLSFEQQAYLHNLSNPFHQQGRTR